MDIRNWPMDRIMQLPDCVFGRRWLMACEKRSVSDTEAFDITELALPEKCVIWNLALDTSPGEGLNLYVRLALGDQLPTTTAMMSALEPLFPGLGFQGAEPREITLRSGVFVVSWPLRMPVASAGRRMVLGVMGAETPRVSARVVIEVSSIPTEVPDWLSSPNLRSP